MRTTHRSDKNIMTTAAADAPAFDYTTRIFGDEAIIDPRGPSWASVRMRRCLASLAEVRGQVLEVGCGAGRCIRTIRHQRPDLAAFGCDLSDRAIETARGHRDGVRYEVADALDLPYEDGRFDAVVVMDLLEHVPDVPGLLGEVRRVLRPGGRLHLHVPCEGAGWSLYRPLLAVGVDLTRAAVGHVHHFTPVEVVGHLEAAAFRVLRIRRSMYWFQQAHDLITWWGMLRRGRTGDPAETALSGKPGIGADPVPGGFRWKHLLSRPAWWVARTFLPRLQTAELCLLGWQPIGSIGLCVTADSDPDTRRDSDPGRPCR